MQLNQDISEVIFPFQVGLFNLKIADLLSNHWYTPTLPESFGEKSLSLTLFNYLIEMFMRTKFECVTFLNQLSKVRTFETH